MAGGLSDVKPRAWGGGGPPWAPNDTSLCCCFKGASKPARLGCAAFFITGATSVEVQASEPQGGPLRRRRRVGAAVGVAGMVSIACASAGASPVPLEPPGQWVAPDAHAPVRRVAVVLLGSTAAHQSLRPMAASLAAHGHGVLMMATARTGTTGDGGRPATGVEEPDRVGQALRWVLTQRPGAADRVALVGVSDAAPAALGAASHGAPVDGVVALLPTDGRSTRGMARLRCDPLWAPACAVLPLPANSQLLSAGRGGQPQGRAGAASSPARGSGAVGRLSSWPALMAFLRDMEAPVSAQGVERQLAARVGARVGGRVAVLGRGLAAPRASGGSAAPGGSAAAGGREDAGSASSPWWPGFEPMHVPLAIFDGQRTWLFRHPAPPSPYVAVDGSPGVFVRAGQEPLLVANSHVELAGVATATVWLDEAQARRPAREIAAMAVHEAFHVFQRRHRPAWVANEADLFSYPADDAQAHAGRLLETHALRRATESVQPEEAACWARAAVHWRQRRFERLGPTAAAYERAGEFNEGLASYVEGRAAGRPATRLRDGDWPPDAVRERLYASGEAWARLLSRFVEGFPASLPDDPAAGLDGVLAAHLPVGRACQVDAGLHASAVRVAQTQVAELGERRRALAREFDASPGQRLTVQAPGSAPLWPAGFDPMNIVVPVLSSCCTGGFWRCNRRRASCGCTAACCAPWGCPVIRCSTVSSKSSCTCRPAWCHVRWASVCSWTPVACASTWPARWNPTRMVAGGCG